MSSYDATKDYYAILGLSVEDACDSSMLKKRYYKLALAHHPDKTGNQDCERFKLILEAFEVLRDSSLKSEYDNERQFQRSSWTNFPESDTEDTPFEFAEPKAGDEEKNASARKRRGRPRKNPGEKKKPRATPKPTKTSTPKKSEKQSGNADEASDAPETFGSHYGSNAVPNDILCGLLKGDFDFPDDSPIWYSKCFAFEAYYHDDEVCSKAYFFQLFERAVGDADARWHAAKEVEKAAYQAMEADHTVNYLMKVDIWKEAKAATLELSQVHDRSRRLYAQHAQRALNLMRARKAMRTRKRNQQHAKKFADAPKRTRHTGFEEWFNYHGV